MIIVFDSIWHKTYFVRDGHARGDLVSPVAGPGDLKVRRFLIGHFDQPRNTVIIAKDQWQFISLEGRKVLENNVRRKRLKDRFVQIDV